MAGDGGGASEWWPVLVTAGSVALLRAIDILLPKGRHLKILDKYLTESDDDKEEKGEHDPRGPSSEDKDG